MRLKTLKRPEHLSLADIAYNVLLEAIVNHEFAPGEQISIDSIARQLNMSNTPVREALMRANGERLVRQKTNHGFVVSPLLTPKEFHELFDVRHLLETHAAQLAVPIPEVVEEIRRLVSQMVVAKDGMIYQDFKDYLALDHQLHRAIVTLAGNDFLLKAWEDLHVHLHLSRLYTGIGLVDREDSGKEHIAILDALERGDTETLAMLLSQHIRRVEERLGALVAP
jgi:DNA-binding GntR family transcriptional regulator